LRFSSDQLTEDLKTILDRFLITTHPKRLDGICAFLGWNYILYLQKRSGIEDDVSTFEYFFRYSLQSAASHSFEPSAASTLVKTILAYGVWRSDLDAFPFPVRGEYLVKFATCLQARFFENGFDRQDLDEAVDLLRQALALCDDQ
jgi:hypothetical protein